MELRWLLHAGLGRTLRSILLDESPAFRPSLSSVTPCVSSYCRRRFKFHLFRDHQFPNFQKRTETTTPSTIDVLGFRSERSNHDCYFFLGYVCDVRVYGSPHLWYSGVSVLVLLSLAKFTHAYISLDGDSVNRHRLLSSWTLHFAAKKTSEDL
jgi:hypothetical protein